MSDEEDDASGSDCSEEWSKAELIVIQKADELINDFDRHLDPFEYFYSVCFKGIPMRVKVRLQMICRDDETPTYPPQLTELLDHTYSVFLSVSSWRNERGEVLPNNWSEQRAQLEAGWPSRARFFRSIREVLRDYSVTHVDALGKYYRARCWGLIRKAVRLHGVVAFWVHFANRPGSTGFRSAVDACHELMARTG